MTTTAPGLATWHRYGLVGAGVIVLGLTASGDDGPVLCPFRICTGGYCPGCGMTRGIGAALRGDLVGSWRHHPFVLVAAIQVAIVLAVWAVVDPERWRSLRARSSVLVAANAAVVVGIWGFRLATGAIPAPFL